METTTDEEKEYYALVEKVFGMLAPFYDAIALPILPVRKCVATLIPASSGSRILDVATGTGKQAFAFGRKGYEVVGIDLSEAMLQIAKKQNRYVYVGFARGDATRLPFTANSFEVSCVSFALHDMPLSIREKTLTEMVRITKPGGMIVIVDYALPVSKIGSFLIYHLVRLYEGEYYTTFIKSDLRALLRAAGIEVRNELQILLGAGKILTGTKKENSHYAHSPFYHRFHEEVIQ